jgi:predicted small secreted protein
VKSKLKLLFGNSFQVDSNIKGAKVIYIDDPYNRNKDIICYTPCKIKIPWEPQRRRANKARILVEKDGYKSQIVDFKIDSKFIIGLLVATFIVTIFASYIGHTYNISELKFLLLAVIIFANISISSGDLYINLEQENK